MDWSIFSQAGGAGFSSLLASRSNRAMSETPDFTAEPQQASSAASIHAFHDNFLYRDPQPALPSVRPLDFLPDTRVVVARGDGLLPVKIAEAHQHTGDLRTRSNDGPGPFANKKPHRQEPRFHSIGRSPVYIYPSRDLAFQVREYYQRLLDTPPRTPGIFPHFFWAFGNPPLLAGEDSAQLVGRLREASYLDARGIPTRLLDATQLAAVLPQLAWLRGYGAEDKLQAISLAFNVVHDFHVYGSYRVWCELYPVDTVHAGRSNNIPSDWSLERIRLTKSNKEIEARHEALSTMFARADKHYLDTLLLEALWASSDDATKAKFASVDSFVAHMRNLNEL